MRAAHRNTAPPDLCDLSSAHKVEACRWQPLAHCRRPDCRENYRQERVTASHLPAEDSWTQGRYKIAGGTQARPRLYRLRSLQKGACLPFQVHVPIKKIAVGILEPRRRHPSKKDTRSPYSAGHKAVHVRGHAAVEPHVDPSHIPRLDRGGDCGICSAD
jgi:hypothetical protein